MTATPYITPAQLISLPTGVQWNTLPRPQANPTEQLAVQRELCWTATRWVDGHCAQPLRAVRGAEVIPVGGPRASVDQGGTLTLWPRRTPVRSVVSVEVRPVVLTDDDYQAVDADGIVLLGVGDTDDLAAGLGAASVLATRQWMPWGAKPGRFLARLTYVSGWGHGGLTVSGGPALLTLALDNALGFQAGDVAEIPDGASTEYVTVASVALNVDGQGGTLTLTATTAFAHGAGTVVTTLPAPIWQATGYIAASLALNRGSASVTVPVLRGTPESVPQKGPDYAGLACRLLAPYRRRF